MNLSDLKSTPLLAAHRRENAKLVPFAGWQMPIEFKGILQEHKHVRSDKGIFDLSHMGEIEVTGEDAPAFLQSLVTNDLSVLQEGQAIYTVMCNEAGGILDDMVIYNLPEKYLLVVNASNTEKILQWMESRKPPGWRIGVHDRTEDLALIAVQGPNAEKFLEPLSETDLPSIAYYHARPGRVASIPCLLSRTGYTGEDGFELYVDSARADELWQILREKGGSPIGLGARDTLRLESAYLLYGNDIDETTSPLEAGLAWVVKLGKEDFVGKAALVEQKERGLSRKLIGFVMGDRALARPGYPISSGGKRIGHVTSGTFSPTLGKGIGLGYVEPFSGTELEIEIRGELHPAVIGKRPFVQGSVKRGS